MHPAVKLMTLWQINGVTEEERSRGQSDTLKDYKSQAASIELRYAAVTWNLAKLCSLRTIRSR